MNKLITNSFLLCCLILFDINIGMAQSLTGSKTIPGDYASLAAAIDDLNTNGVGPGGVTFLVAAGHEERAPIGGYIVNATGTASNQIVFSRVGIGNNPLLYAQAGTSTNADGVFVLSGSDYVTINGIDLVDTNVVSNPNQMEWGYALLRASATNAPQYVTIQNCRITLNKQNTASTGIYSGCHLVTNTTPLTITSVSGALSNCKLLNNSISNAYIGILLSGFNDLVSPYSFYDQNNQIGAEGNGNVITNFGGSSVAARGIYTIYQNNLSISNNSIIGGTGTTGILHGIWVGAAAASQTTIHKNNIQDTSSSTTSGAHMYGIQSDAGTGSGGKVIIDSNKVNFCYFTQPTQSSTFWGIMYSGGADSMFIFGNHIDSNRIYGTGTFYAIQQTAGASNVNSRLFRNQIYANTKLTSGSGAMYMMSFNLNASIRVFNNNIYNDTSNAIGFLYGIHSSTATLGDEWFYGNNISYIVGNSTGGLYGMYIQPSTNSGTKYIYDNKLWGFRSASASNSYGIYAGNGLNINVFKNRVYDFFCAGASSAFSPIYLAGNNGTTINAYNNYVYDIRLTATASNAAIRGIHLASGVVNLNLHHNTVYLNNVSTGAAITACLYVTAGGIGSQDIRNNIFINNSTQIGIGRAIVYQRSNTTLNTHTATSDGNLFYAGTPSSSRFIFYDGTSFDTTLQQFKTRLINREKLSVSENVTFVNTLTPPYDMHIDPTIPTPCESGGFASGLVTQDFYGTPRNVNTPDIGAEEGTFIASDLLTPSISYKSLGDTTVFLSRIVTGVTISDFNKIDTVSGNKPRIYFKKSTEANTISGNTSFDNGWKFVQANNNTSPFFFTINQSLLTSSLTQGDVIQYFVVAQDKSAATNVGIKGGTFALAPSSVSLLAPSFPITELTDSFVIKTGISGTFTVGASSPNYITLTQAVADLNDKVLTGPVELLLLDASYTSPTETFPISINANGGSSATNTVTIKPQTGVISTIGASINGAILVLNGIDYLTLDGKQHTTTIGKNLFIENTNANAGASAITFINDACYNKVTDLTLKGANAPSNGNGGVVVFSTGLTIGNDFNIIDSCDITAVSSSNLPSTLIYASGTNSVLERYNDQNTIINCKLYDYWNATSEFNALKLVAGNNNWTISQNHIYQTTPRSTSATHTALNFIHSADYTSLNGMNINHNYIGGSDAFCGGAPWTQLASNGAFTNVFNMGGFVYSRFSQNIITNFLCNTTSTSTAVPGAWNAVQWANGLLNIDSNTFGSKTDTTAIFLNSTSTTSGIGMNVVVAANFASTGTFSISGNTFGGFKVSNSFNLSTNLYIINVTSTGGDIQTYNINNNVIGNMITGNIQALNSTSTTAQSIAGIYFPGSFGFYLNVKNNIIRNMTNQYAGTGGGFTQGVAFNGSPTGIHNISNNVISYLINYSPQSNGVPTPNNTVSVMGLQLATTGTNSVCSGNRIYNLINTNPFAVNTCVVGINIRNTVNAVVSNNNVSRLSTGSISAGGPGAGSAIYGISHSSGSCRIQNNMISLGRDSIGNSITTTPTIAGIYKASSASIGCYFNTIKISGTGVGTGLGTTYAFRRSTSAGDTLINNIFENSRTNSTTGGGHYALHVTTGTTLLSNYNIFHSDNISVGDTLISVNGIPYTTIPLWTIASGADSHSKDTLVDFVSNTDLHLNTSMYGLMTFKGMPVNNVLADIDGDSRTNTPYMGADEIASNPLPVEWIMAKATVISNNVVLDWSTASEVNTGGFIIERSIDGKIFNKVSFVKGGGNGNVIRSYNTVDTDPFKREGVTVLYYRIKQTDLNGEYSYSKIMSVNLDKNKSSNYIVYPNPFEDAVSVDLEKTTFQGKVEIKLIDLMGRTVLNTTQYASENNVLIHIPNIPSGLYILNITNNGQTQSIKLSKK